MGFKLGHVPVRNVCPTSWIQSSNPSHELNYTETCTAEARVRGFRSDDFFKVQRHAHVLQKDIAPTCDFRQSFQRYEVIRFCSKHDQMTHSLVLVTLAIY